MAEKVAVMDFYLRYVGLKRPDISLLAYRFIRVLWSCRNDGGEILDARNYTVATLVFPGTFCAIVQAILILSGNKVAIW